MMKVFLRYLSLVSFNLLDKKDVHFHFLSSPISFGYDSESNLTHVNFQRLITFLHLSFFSSQRMKLTGPARHQKAISNAETHRIDTNTAILSLGFKGDPLPGLPFNEKLGILYTR
jgi:hypothetical protein